MRVDKFLFVVMALALIASCGGGGGGGHTSRQTEEDHQTGVTYDSELSSSERRSLGSSTKALASYQLDGRKVKGFFEVFGGGSSANVVNYFKTRVHYALSASTDLNTRVIANSAAVNRALEVFASNPSAAIWYYAKASEPADVNFLVNNKQVDINSTRIGVMQFGGLYVDSPTATQAATLVHEARHSDCTGGALAADIERYRNGDDIKNHKCGYLHDVCPPGHSNEGIAACESLHWGAYMIDAIYSAAIMSACETCSETDKQAAEINFNDVIQRPLYDVEALLNGDFGPPDMSSSNQVR